MIRGPGVQMPASLTTKEEIQRWCVSYVARALNQPEARVSPDADLESFGLDSALLVEMVVQLEELLDMEISPSLVFDQPSISRLSGHLAAARKAR